ncbi:MAG: hypothetical protein BIFFINMI_03085 [Phycisphaerae bacterium]|nr:hypothetical protein [Phycisphaerae bacterium]
MASEAGKSRTTKDLLFDIVLLAGAGLWLAAFFVPWWHISVDPDAITVDLKGDTKAQFELNGKAYDALVDNVDWYRAHLPAKSVPSLTKPPAQLPTQTWNIAVGAKLSEMLWGWTVATAITTFIFCLLIIALVLTPWFVPLLRPWTWLTGLMGAVVGVIGLILSLVWVFGSPGGDADAYLSQGVIAGPFVELAGSVLVLGGSVFTLIFGLQRFIAWIKGFRTPKPAAK